MDLMSSLLANPESPAPKALILPQTPGRSRDSQFVTQSTRTRRTCGLSLLEWGVLSLFSAVALVTGTFHEPWSDEAQAWLIARDLPFKKMLLQVKYEGTPPLWHALLWVFIRLHLPYSRISVIPAVLMIAAIYIWLRHAPLPAFLRILAPFTFFMQYQYAVVARTYSLTTLLAFAVAAVWVSRKRSILLLGILLALMCQTNLYGFALTGGITAVLWLELFMEARRQPVTGRQRVEFWVATAMIIASACIAVWLAWPPADLSFPGTAGYSHISHRYWWVVFTTRVKLALKVPFASTFLASVLILSLSAWLGERKRGLCIIPFAVTLFVAGALYYKAWHLGMLVVGLLISIWLAWPMKEFQGKHIWTYIFSCVLLIVFLIQIRWTFISVCNDIQKPYSGAKATAAYLRPQIGQWTVYGAGYPSVAVLPYFDHNVFANQSFHSYWAWSVNDMSDQNLLTRRFDRHSIVVFSWTFMDEKNRSLLLSVLNAQDFRVAQSFCGHLFLRDSYSELSCYDIYEKD